MRRLIVVVYATLDGVIDGKGNAAIERWQLPKGSRRSGRP
jgi:hypothetical protein